MTRMRARGGMKRQVGTHRQHHITQPPRIPNPLITAALHASDAQLIAAVSASVCKPPLATKRLASSHELLLAKAFLRTEVKSWGCVRGAVRVSLVGV